MFTPARLAATTKTAPTATLLIVHHLGGGVRARVRASSLTATLLIVHLAQEELGLQASNFWICDSDAAEQSRTIGDYAGRGSGWDEEFPSVFLSFPSTKDRLWNERFPGRSVESVAGFTKCKRTRGFLDLVRTDSPHARLSTTCGGSERSRVC